MNFWQFLTEYTYNGFDIDEGIPLDIVKQLNKIKFIEICSTCSGHPNGTGINFILKKYKNKTISELKEYLDLLINNIKIENTSVEWSVWTEPGALLYNSKNGYNKKVLKLFNNSKKLAESQIPYRIMVHVVFDEGSESSNFDQWWIDITKKLQEITF